MQLFLMRHGEASFDALSDRERVLTDLGRYQTRQMANWLTGHVAAFDLVLLSPYLRAQQSWQEVVSQFPEPCKFMMLDELLPNADPAKAASLIQAYAMHCKADKVLVISHMPLLGYLVSDIVGGVEPPLFATSAIGMIDVHGERASLGWLAAPHSID
ncbi:MAG: phosphohistidine phosphatase SixA [Shewanella sp.]|nr:phosphohistidine phosphatase SixA [Shewanella sp.]MCF1430194.1 phosphohistidine phosphatase SixA [Shewanella sp.]MCF1437531.1 phosphohistidine phosphatase SixA [Shewanella sp.]MCF1458999.1 phosphohistidine phosphatase SixA [Shewanella sp.]